MILKPILNIQTGSIFCFGGRWGVPCFLLRRMSTVSIIRPPLGCSQLGKQQMLHVNLGPWGTSPVPDADTLDVSQYHVREYLATDVLPCAPFLLLPRAPWFLMRRQPLRVSWSGIQGAPQSGSQVGALRTWCVCVAGGCGTLPSVSLNAVKNSLWSTVLYFPSCSKINQCTTGGLIYL